MVLYGSKPVKRLYAECCPLATFNSLILQEIKTTDKKEVNKYMPSLVLFMYYIKKNTQSASSFNSLTQLDCGTIYPMKLFLPQHFYLLRKL